MQPSACEPRAATTPTANEDGRTAVSARNRRRLPRRRRHPSTLAALPSSNANGIDGSINGNRRATGAAPGDRAAATSSEPPKRAKARQRTRSRRTAPPPSPESTRGTAGPNRAVTELSTDRARRDVARAFTSFQTRCNVACKEPSFPTRCAERSERRPVGGASRQRAESARGRPARGDRATPPFSLIARRGARSSPWSRRGRTLLVRSLFLRALAPLVGGHRDLRARRSAVAGGTRGAAPAATPARMLKSVLERRPQSIAQSGPRL